MLFNAMQNIYTRCIPFTTFCVKVHFFFFLKPWSKSVGYAFAVRQDGIVLFFHLWWVYKYFETVPLFIKWEGQLSYRAECQEQNFFLNLRLQEQNGKYKHILNLHGFLQEQNGKHTTLLNPSLLTEWQAKTFSEPVFFESDWQAKTFSEPVFF